MINITVWNMNMGTRGALGYHKDEDISGGSNS